MTHATTPEQEAVAGQAPLTALVLYTSALGHDKQADRERGHALDKLNAGVDALELREPNDQRQYANVLIELTRHPSVRTPEEFGQVMRLYNPRQRLATLDKDQLERLRSEARRLPTPARPEAEEALRQLMDEPFAQATTSSAQALTLKPPSQPGSQHSDYTTSTLLHTALRRLVEHEKAQRSVEAQVEQIKAAGAPAMWYYEHSKRTFKTLFEGAIALLNDKRRHDPSVGGEGLAGASAQAMETSGAVGGAAAGFLTTLTALAQGVPVLSGAAQMLGQMADFHAEGKFNKDNSRIGKILDGSRDTVEQFCDTMARALTLLHLPEVDQIAQRKEAKMASWTGCRLPPDR
jgi:hypothetical protein